MIAAALSFRQRQELKNLLLIVLAGVLLCPFTHAQTTFADPASVLVIVQDNTGPEPGTGTQNASQYVADYYMRRRGIPAANIVHISTFIENGGGASCVPGAANCQLQHSSSTNIHNALYQSQIAAPILAKLDENNGALRSQIKYIVPVYGVPVTIWSVLGVDALSLDNVLAGILLPSQGKATANPYYNADPASSPPHIDASTSGILLVSRLDGRTAALAAGLVDKAIAGETAGVQGIGYFDWQGHGTAANQLNGYPFQPDFSMLNAYTLCTGLVPSQTCVLNNQSAAGGMISSAPNTAWAWGWYDPSAANAGAYSFVPGAVGAQLTSYTANCIRRPCPGAYVDLWLAQGITATWGAVSEPFASYYALGDNLLSHLWRGYTFGESAYISSPVLNWMMVFVGDPLYRPSYAQISRGSVVCQAGESKPVCPTHRDETRRR
jgi:uncharacterized protein (TIGR03790 family)